jgi:hypothetical protein
MLFFKTCLIITCSPSNYNEQETLSTLRFGERAKKIKNKPKINKEVTVAELKAQVEKLEKLLHTCNKRISQLENFITKNKLKVPDENDYSYMNKADEIEQTQVNTETNIDITDNDESDGFFNNKEMRSISPILGEQDKKLHEMAYHERMTYLLENNRDLNDKLEDAISSI